MSKYSSLFTETVQTSPIKGEEHKQARNHAGGFVYTMDKFKRLERFLILGSDGNTYYQKAPALTKENASCVIKCWEENPQETANVIRSISLEGRAPKNSPAIFAIALGCTHADVKVRKFAHNSISSVCRTSTHLFELIDTYDKLGGKGFGRGMKRAISNWYNNKTDEQLAYQLVKYRQREGYTHKRMIQRCRPKQEVITSARAAMYDWLCGREVVLDSLPQIIYDHQCAMATSEEDLGRVVAILQEQNLPWEALPTWANTHADIWRVMLPDMPLTALLRNLGNMTRLGVFNDAGLSTNIAMSRITDEHNIRKARLHPFNILFGAKTYGEGKGFRGSNVWTPVSGISKALEVAFYKSFKFVPSTNKRICIAFDISPSMDGHKIFNSSLSARDASSAMAMATIAPEPEENILCVAFSSMHAHNFRGGRWGGALMNVSDRVKKGKSLSEITSFTKNLPYEGTDCSLPILGAMRENLEFDAFIVYTDNETFAGRMHPSEALREYRRYSGIEDAKLIVVGMTSTGFSIADPDDPNMLDVVGFDTSAPAVISSFLRDHEHEPHALLEHNIRETVEEKEEDSLDEGA